MGQSSLLCFLKYCDFITVVLITQGGARKTENIDDIYFNHTEIKILLLCYLQKNTLVLFLFKNYFLMTVIVKNINFLVFLENSLPLFPKCVHLLIKFGSLLGPSIIPTISRVKLKEQKFFLNHQFLVNYHED